jgi:hypothetical protein
MWMLTVIAFSIGIGQGQAGFDLPWAQAATAGTKVDNHYQAEPQDPSGKFTTATEVKPILTATKGNWVAVREYDGRDLVYFTHLLAWRCGIAGLRYSINGAEMVDYPVPACQTDTATPNALPADHLPFIYQPLKSVETVAVEVIYDDLSRDTAEFERKAVLIP